MGRILRSTECNGRVVISSDTARLYGPGDSHGPIELEAIEIAEGHELFFQSEEALRVSVDRLVVARSGVVRVAAPLELTARAFGAADTPSVIVVGADGPNGPAGANAPPTSSAPGGNGANGGHGGDAYDAIFTFDTISGTFIVIARGGKGGSGGNGGSGGTRAPGGNGGAGGDGGNGSKVVIRFKTLAPDTNLQIDTAPAAGGAGGAGGQGGPPAYLMGLPGRYGTAGQQSSVVLQQM